MPRLSILVLLLLPAALATATAKPLDPAVSKRIDADVHTVLERTGAPSAVIVIVDDGRVVYRKAYGLRDVERKLAAATDTHYEIGSITKQFTAAAILQLQEAGKLRIDDKLSKYLPEASHADEVTLRQLLSHTSGLPEYLDAMEEDHTIDKPARFDQLMAHVTGKPLDFAPGSRWAYSNTGYALLGRIIETVSHESYRHYLQTHLLDPAGMTKTYTVADEPHLANRAIGYYRENGRVERASTIADSVGWAAGFLVSTIDDLQKWNAALEHGRIVTPADYALMATSVQTSEAGDAGYGFGLFVDTIDDQPRFGHTGGSLGFTTANEFFPKQKMRIIAFTNLRSNPEPGETITTAVFDALFPDIAAAAARPAPDEDADTSAKAKALFAAMQSGTPASPLLGTKLDAKMKTGLAKRLADLFGPYGAPTHFVYKGTRTGAGLSWYDYVIEFGPGSRLKFSVALDQEKKIVSISYG